MGERDRQEYLYHNNAEWVMGKRVCIAKQGNTRDVCMHRGEPVISKTGNPRDRVYIRMQISE